MSLKKFEILEMIAKGGMAEVYLAKTTGFQGFEKQVCVKKILPHLTEDESFVTMFVNEAKLAATLNYANIVQVHDLCVSAGGEYFIVMEYVNGKDLSDVIRAAQLAGREIPPDIAVYVVREVCKGLYYAHNRTDDKGANLNIIHRDISPHNVLVSFMGEVKITDFGIAKASSIANKTAVGILKGKYGYMSPEQARGQPLDHRSDIFNTGIVLYELLVGERCFAGSSDFSTLNLMRNAEVTPPTKIVSSIPKDLEALVLRTLSKDKKDRFQDALELEGALGDWAKSAGQVATATELARFMRELFAQAEERGKDGATGVLSLSSVVGPAPTPEAPSAQHQVSAPAPAAPPPEAKAASVKSEPGKEALERAKRRATKARSKAAEPEAAPAPSVQVGPPPEPPKKEAPAKPAAEAEPAEQAAPSKPAPAKPEPAKEEAPKAEAAAKKEAPTAEPAKKERKPARLPKADEAKGAKAAKAPAKKKGKQLSEGPKVPVGRKQLRPGLTRIQKMQTGPSLGSWLVGGAVVLAALVVGAIVGTYRGKQVSRQTTFRQMEVTNREGGPLSTVTVFITSEPPGATVRFDSRELSGKTPVAVERDRDDQEHQIILALDGYEKAVRSLKYESGPITLFEAELEGDPGRLEVSTQPSELPVFLDGVRIGETPLFREIPQGKHVLELGGGDRAKLREEIVVRPGKKTKVSRKVPSAAAMAQLRLDSEPKARIILNGEPTGKFTGDGVLPLAPGIDHDVALEVGGKKPKRKHLRINLERGEDRSVFVDLTSS